MFFALARLIVLILVVSTVAYVCLWFYVRANQRARLEEAWYEEGQRGERATYVEAGLESQRLSLQRRLLIGVYAVPILVVTVIVYLTNQT